MFEVRLTATVFASLLAIALIGSNFPGNVFLEVQNLPIFFLVMASTLISASILFGIKNVLVFSTTTTLLSTSLYFLFMGCANMFIHGENPIEYLILVPFAIIIFWKEFIISTLTMSALEFLLGKLQNERSSKSS